MADSSFDIVSKVDKQEVDNALNQASKEVAQRYDFKNVDALIEWSGEKIKIEANAPERALAILDVFESKLIKRGVSLKAVDFGDKEPKPQGKIVQFFGELKEGLSSETAKQVSKIIREEGPKNVKSSIQGEAVRCVSKSRDDLQEVIALLKTKAADIDAALQYENYR